MRAAIPLAILLLSSSAANAAVVQFGNENAEFVLIGGLGGGTAPGLFLDPTLSAASQSQSRSERGIYYVIVSGGGSETPNADSMSGGLNLRVARSSAPVNVFNSSGTLFQFFPAETLASGDRVVNQDFQQSVAAALFYVGGGNFHTPFLGQTPITAFRLDLADGPHFGWVQWRFGPGPHIDGGTFPMYQPIRWAYETEPNTPITVPGPAPGTVLLLGAGLLAARRRRGA